MSQQRQPGVDSDAVLDAAASCYLRFGVSKTTAADIAQEVGISRATLYRRFGSHEAIFLAVLTRESAAMAADAEVHLAGIVDPEEKRRIVGDEFIRIFAQEARKLGHIDFLAQGVGKNVKNIASLELDVVQSSNNVLMYVNRAPHPNASKVFANWILTKEGGTSMAKYAQDNSRRADVEVFDASVVPDQDYVKIDSESYVDEILKTQKIATDVLG